MTAAINHPLFVFAKAKIVKFTFRIIGIAGQRFVVLPLAPQNRYAGKAGKDIRRNVAAAALGFMTVNAATVRPDPFAWIDCPIPNTCKPYAVGKHPIPAHNFHSRPVHRLMLPQ